jgi:hypothetical protein
MFTMKKAKSVPTLTSSAISVSGTNAASCAIGTAKTTARDRHQRPERRADDPVRADPRVPRRADAGAARHGVGADADAGDPDAPRAERPAPRACGRLVSSLPVDTASKQMRAEKIRAAAASMPLKPFGAKSEKLSPSKAEKARSGRGARLGDGLADDHEDPGPDDRPDPEGGQVERAHTRAAPV